MPNKNYIQTVFDETYKDEAFYIWYKAGRIETKALIEMLPVTVDLKKPSIAAVNTWRVNNNWEIRADALDAKVSEQLDKEVITERVQMLHDHAEKGKKMAQIGMDFLMDKENGGIQSDSAAIRAVVEGAALERNNRGMADAYLKIMSMSETDLDKQLKLLLTGKEDSIIEADVEDVTDDAAEETNS